MVKIKRIMIVFLLAFVLVVSGKGVHAYHRQSGVFFGDFYYNQQMTDFYSLFPEVRFHDGLNDIYEHNGKYYYSGDLQDLVRYRQVYYGDDNPIFTLHYGGWSAFEPGDEWIFANGLDLYQLPLGSQVILQSNTFRVVNNGELVYDFNLSSLNNSQLVFQKNYGYDPDYYIGLDEGYNNGFSDGQFYGEYLHQHDYQNGYDSGLDYGYDSGYADGFTDGFESTEDGGMWGVLWSAILAPFSILNIEMLPGITLAMIVAVPLVFGLLGWILSTGKSRK